MTSPARMPAPWQQVEMTQQMRDIESWLHGNCRCSLNVTRGVWFPPDDSGCPDHESEWP